MIISSSDFDFAKYQAGDYGDHCIIHGDCRDVLPKIPDKAIDLVLTDPPYLEGDFSWVLDIVTQPLVVSPGKLESFNWIAKRKPFWEYAWRGQSRSLGGSACLHIGFEPILAYCRPIKPLGNDVLDYNIGEISRYDYGHPWPKPLKLWAKLMSHWSNESNLILDPFLGSGTTLVAAKNLGRRAIGIEINYEYCKIAEQRMAQEVLSL